MYYKTANQECIEALKDYQEKSAKHRMAAIEISKKIGGNETTIYTDNMGQFMGFVFDSPPNGYTRLKCGGYYPNRRNKELRQQINELPAFPSMNEVNRLINFKEQFGDGPRYIFSVAMFKYSNELYFRIPQGCKYEPLEYITEIKGSEYLAAHEKLNESK